MTSFAGVIPPVVTPRHQDRSFDEESFGRVIDHLLDNGVHGLFVLGSTGEGVFADDAMRAKVISESVRRTAGRVPVMVGVIDTQTDRVRRHIETAVALGADAVVVTAPFYAITHEPEIRRHFEVLASASPVPVFAYDIPVCVHTKLRPELLLELGRQGIIAGVKDSSLDDVAFRQLALLNEDAGHPLTLLTGHEVMVDGMYLAGADGCVPGLGNVDPAGYVALHEAALAQDWERSREIQDALARLMQIASVPRSTSGWGAGVGSFKTALKLRGLIESDQVPEPFHALDETDTEAIAELLAAHTWSTSASRPALSALSR